METTGIILAGGKGTRMGNLTIVKHKCLLKVGNFPILTHLILQLSCFKIDRVIICSGYLSEKIKIYLKKKLDLDLEKLSKILKIKSYIKPKIIINKSGIKDSTSQRLFKIKKLIGNSNLLILYGDTLMDVNYNKFQIFLKKNMGKSDVILTLSNPKEKFGVVKLKNNKVISFSEKIIDRSRWVNSGWMLVKNKLLKKISNSNINFENYLFKKNLDIKAYKNYFYYQPIDNISDLNNANKNWKKNKKTWFTNL